MKGKKDVPFTEYEDYILVSHVAQYGFKWTTCVQKLPHRTKDSLRGRYLRLVNLSQTRRQKLEEEQREIYEKYMNDPIEPEEIPNFLISFF